MEKEKSVLTEEERRGIAYSHHGGAEQYMSIVIETEQKVLAKVKEKQIAISYLQGFSSGEQVLANYKKGLREKVQERMDELEGGISNNEQGQMYVLRWLLKEIE